MPSKISTAVRRHLLLLLTLAMLAFANDAGAQSGGPDPFGSDGAKGVAFHRFLQAGEVPMLVEVVGHVRSPGLYEVSLDTDLSRMLALAGGTSEGLRSSGERVELRVDLYREEANRQNLIYTMPLDSLFIAGHPYPDLRDGDVINVHGTVERKFSWRDTLSIATSAAALALFVERLIRILG